MSTPSSPPSPSPVLARPGVWTPWARVLCAECDYAELRSSARAEYHARRVSVLSAMDRTGEVACPDGDALATCDRCHVPCWAREDVALLQRVGLQCAAPDGEGSFSWSLEQTGGMCAALVLSCDDRRVVVTATDGFFLVGEYHQDDESWESPTRTWESAPLYQGVEALGPDEVGQLVSQCARRVVAWVGEKVSSTVE